MREENSLRKKSLRDTLASTRIIRVNPATNSQYLFAMNLYFKFFMLIFSRLVHKKSQQLDSVCYSHFKVGFLDLDLYMHMNNSRYLSVMDLGRIDLLIRSGILYKLLKGGYLPVVKSESIAFEKSLKLWQRYKLATQLNAWDEKFLYVTQNFECNGKLMAAAHVRVCFKKRGVRGIVPVKELFDFIGGSRALMNMSDLSLHHEKNDDLLVSKASL